MVTLDGGSKQLRYSFNLMENFLVFYFETSNKQL
jgi:hypothetical protein